MNNLKNNGLPINFELIGTQTYLLSDIINDITANIHYNISSGNISADEIPQLSNLIKDSAIFISAKLSGILNIINQSISTAPNYGSIGINEKITLIELINSEIKKNN